MATSSMQDVHLFQHSLNQTLTRVMCASSSKTSSAATSGGEAATAWLMLPRVMLKLTSSTLCTLTRPPCPSSCTLPSWSKARGDTNTPYRTDNRQEAEKVKGCRYKHSEMKVTQASQTRQAIMDWPCQSAYRHGHLGMHKKQLNQRHLPMHAGISSNCVAATHLGRSAARGLHTVKHSKGDGGQVV